MDYDPLSLIYDYDIDFVNSLTKVDDPEAFSLSCDSDSDYSTKDSDHDFENLDSDDFDFDAIFGVLE